MDCVNSSAAPSKHYVPYNPVEPGHFKDLACEDICTEHHFIGACVQQSEKCRLAHCESSHARLHLSCRMQFKIQLNTIQRCLSQAALGIGSRSVCSRTELHACDR